MRLYYSQSKSRLNKIKDYIKLASKYNNNRFIQQSLGHGLYTTIEIEKRKAGRKKRCAVCATAVKTYMDAVMKDITPAKFDDMMGVNEKLTLMFAIDDTGSMHNEIDAAKAIATYIVDHPRQDTTVDYILSPFNDPKTGPVQHMKAGKGKEFIKAIERLRPHGGGDCPEFAFRGIIDALNEGSKDDAKSPLYVFTDATAKDDNDENTMMARITAKSKGTSVYFFTTGLCGKTSYKPFEDLAKETCGQMFELPKNSFDLSKMKKISKGLLASATCSSGGGIDPFGKKRRSPRNSVYKLPFDDSMEKVIVSVTTENSRPMIDLKNPLGVSVSSGKTALPKGAIFEVDHPKPGIWKLIVSSGAGKHSYLIKGSGKTNVDFDFIFVIPRKWMSPLPISHPLVGKSAHAILIVRATDKIRSTSLNLEILSKDDKVLIKTTVTPVGTSGAHFLASFSTPTVPFKLKLRGKTKKNFNFERNSANIVHPSRVLVRVLYARSEFTVPIRGRGLVIFFVYNTDATEIFDFKVKDSSTFSATVLRSAVRVYKNRSGFFYAMFTPKSTATSGAADNVLVTATGRTSKVIVNHVFTLMVV
ncbi:hypothetical protein ACROYT_G007408 [Oculina patagonica]